MLFGLNVVIDELALHLFSVVIYLGIEIRTKPGPEPSSCALVARDQHDWPMLPFGLSRPADVWLLQSALGLVI